MKRIAIIFALLLLISVSVYSVVKKDMDCMDNGVKALVNVSVSAGKPVYAKGEIVTFKLTTKNVSGKKFVCYFPTSQKLDLVIRNVHKEKIWNSSKGKMFMMVTTPIHLKVNEAVSYDVSWDQKDDSGKQVLAGKYFVSGTLTTSKRHKSVQAIFEIK